jgi:hypothetical protein
MYSVASLAVCFVQKYEKRTIKYDFRCVYDNFMFSKTVDFRLLKINVRPLNNIH